MTQSPNVPMTGTAAGGRPTHVLNQRPLAANPSRSVRSRNRPHSKQFFEKCAELAKGCGYKFRVKAVR